MLGSNVVAFAKTGGGEATNFILVNHRLDGEEWALRVHRGFVEGGADGVGSQHEEGLPVKGLKVEFYKDAEASAPLATYTASPAGGGVWRFPPALLTALRAPPGQVLRIHALGPTYNGGSADVWRHSEPISLKGFDDAYTWMFTGPP